MTIREVKELIKAQDPEGAAGMWPVPSALELYYNHHRLEDDRTLKAYGIHVSQAHEPCTVYAQEIMHPPDDWNPSECGQHAVQHLVVRADGWHQPQDAPDEDYDPDELSAKAIHAAAAEKQLQDGKRYGRRTTSYSGLPPHPYDMPTPLSLTCARLEEESSTGDKIDEQGGHVETHIHIRDKDGHSHAHAHHGAAAASNMTVRQMHDQTKKPQVRSPSGSVVHNRIRDEDKHLIHETVGDWYAH